jgi:hypothetical protein
VAFPERAATLVAAVAWVSAHAVTDTASRPLDRRLFAPASWDDSVTNTEVADERVAARLRAGRNRCGTTDGERNRPKWTMAVEMLDELIGWGDAHSERKVRLGS